MRKDVLAALELLGREGFVVLEPEYAERGWRVFAPDENMIDAMGYTPTPNTELLRMILIAEQPAMKARLRSICTSEWGMKGGSFWAAWDRMEGAKAIEETEAGSGMYRHTP